MTGTSLHRIDRGHGLPVLVFIHGFTCSSSDWAPQVEALSERYRCIALDLPGHGRSRSPADPTLRSLANAANDCLDSLRIDEAVLIGHSMGCRMVTEMYAHSPARVRGLVYVDGSLLTQASPDDAVAQFEEIIGRIGMGEFLRRLYEGFFVADTPEGVRSTVLEQLPRVDPAFARSLWLDLVRWDASRYRSLLPTIAVPTLVIQSTYLDASTRRSSLAPGQSQPWLEELSRSIPDVRIEVIPGIGHFPMTEAPDRTIELIGAFTEWIARGRP
ncbi:MAG: alpha/beta hydrolase [Betaproteobacteria bacterium]|nr:alpha/beta hydrolase [Betaproteobacteria bacterium]